MKNKIIALVVALLCLIPTVVAIVSYNKTQNAPVDAGNAVSVTISDTGGKVYTLTKEKDGDEADSLIKYFLGLSEKSTKIVALPDSLMSAKSYKVTVASNLRQENFEFYFSPDPTTNYFVNSKGTAYKMTDADATAFITSKYAESIYDNSTIPTLTLSGRITVSPDSAEWKYKNYTGAYVDADTSSLVVERNETYSVEGGLELGFDLKPDFSQIKVTDADSGNVLYDGTVENMSIFTLTSSKKVTVDVVARWYEDPSRSFRGEMNYAFSADVLAPAEFYLGLTALEAGKFTAVTALNVTDASLIEFTSTMDNTPAVTFYDIGDNRAVAFLPVHADTPAGLYTLSFKYGGITQNTILTVENSGEKISYYYVPEEVVAATRSRTALEQFENAVRDITASSESEQLFKGHFLEGVTGASLQRGFGRDVYLNGSQTVTYRNNGVDYASNYELDVVACNSGTVCYAGYLDYAGNIVVIDHGLGLKTWYYNLGDGVTVSVGDRVERGQKIGVTGQTGFTGSHGVHIAMSVGSQFVSPYDTWQDSPVAGKIIIAKVDE
ncbi:MAG: M23 family metallopeptidase [Clostridia bacterium]|nr:M23 family metallopeptidase [Clostridia bacterium]